MINSIMLGLMGASYGIAIIILTWNMEKIREEHKKELVRLHEKMAEVITKMEGWEE